MVSDRERMIKSLNKIFIPELKKLNFNGSFPNFRRVENDFTNLISVQFDKNGGGFIIEIANYRGANFKTNWGEIIDLKNLAVSDIDINERLRIYPNSNMEINGTDSWFRFDKSHFFVFGNKYDKLANKVNKRIPIMIDFWNQTS